MSRVINRNLHNLSGPLGELITWNIALNSWTYFKAKENRRTKTNLTSALCCVYMAQITKRQNVYAVWILFCLFMWQVVLIEAWNFIDFGFTRELFITTIRNSNTCFCEFRYQLFTFTVLSRVVTQKMVTLRYKFLKLKAWKMKSTFNHGQKLEQLFVVEFVQDDWYCGQSFYFHFLSCSFSLFPV